MSRKQVGDICRWTSGDHTMWFVVTHLGPRGGPKGACILSTHDDDLMGPGYSLGSKHIWLVEQDMVPDRVWAALAKWRLLNG